MNKSTLYTYKDISSLTNNLIWLLRASVFIFVSATIFDFYELKYFNKIINDFTSHNIDVQTLVSIENAIISKQVYIFILQMALAIITGVVFLRWTYFSNSNSILENIVIDDNTLTISGERKNDFSNDNSYYLCKKVIPLFAGILILCLLLFNAKSQVLVQGSSGSKNPFARSILQGRRGRYSIFTGGTFL